MEEVGVLEALEKLQEHKSDDVYHKAANILIAFFNAGDEDEAENYDGVRCRRTAARRRCCCTHNCAAFACSLRCAGIVHTIITTLSSSSLPPLPRTQTDDAVQSGNGHSLHALASAASGENAPANAFSFAPLQPFKQPQTPQGEQHAVGQVIQVRDDSHVHVVRRECVCE